MTATTKADEHFHAYMDKAWEKHIAKLKAKYPPDGVTPKCDHDWNNEGCNPTHCLKCGMSIMAHAMMECP
jgi:hypothetical protein